jgi:hypothetical protein
MALLDGVDFDAMGEEAAALMRKQYPLLFALAYDDAAGALPVDVSFDLERPEVQQAIEGLAKKIKSVSDTTRDKVRSLVSQQAQEGWSMPELAKRIREQGVTDSKYRSVLIGRTESATAYNVGTTYAYQDAGITEVEVFDGDTDAECASVNGTTQSLEWARDNPIAHPQCTRAFSAKVT